MLLRKKLTEVPWTKLRLRRYRTFFSSSSRIFPVVLLSRWISCWASPKGFYQFDITQRLRGGSCQGGGFRHNDLLYLFDLTAEHRTQHAQ